MIDSLATQLSLFDAPNAATSLTVRHSLRARRLAVRVYPGGRAEVVVPPRTSGRVVREFVLRHREWIETRRARAQRERPPAAAFPPPMIELAAFAERWELRIVPGPGRTRLVQIAASPEGPHTLEARGHGATTGLPRLLQAWVRARAAAQLAPWLETLAREAGFSYGRMTVRRQRTRWGSCSTRGTISLNACLAFQRPAVVRYLLLHELAHTRHMNHSTRFWRLVAEHEPHWRELDRELATGWRHVPAWMLNDGT